MPLYLLRHAENFTEEQDPKKGLTSKGIEQIKSVATQAKKYINNLNSITHSNKHRAIQTAEYFNKTLNGNLILTESLDLSPNTDVQNWPPILEVQQNELLVRHLPFLDKLLALLTTGNEDTLVASFGQASLFCLDKHELSQKWKILWALKPYINTTKKY